MIIVTGLAGRSALDKVLAIRGGAELVALWAQLGSVLDLVAAVALSGIGMGLSVLVIQATHPDDQRRLLREAISLGLGASFPVLVFLCVAAWGFGERLAAGALPPWLIAMSALAGWIVIIPGMLNSYWLGQQRRDFMLGLAFLSAVLPLVAAVGVPAGQVLPFVAFASAAPALVAVLLLRKAGAPAPSLEHRRAGRRALLHYLIPGVAIGILSPASMVAARAVVSDAMSWQDAGHLQAIWRVSDWVASVAGGVISVYFLPRLTATLETPAFQRELRRAAQLTVVPAALAFAVMFVFQRSILAWLYDESFRISDTAVALFFLGSLVRIAAWIPLFALYAMKRTGAITAGEFLSLPLFALLLAVFSRSLDLERASVLWFASYLVYGTFNYWAARPTART